MKFFVVLEAEPYSMDQEKFWGLYWLKCHTPFYSDNNMQRVTAATCYKSAATHSVKFSYLLQLNSA